MRSTMRRWLILLLLLIPSAVFAWRSRSMPEFASLHDDGIFFVTAKSIAEGGYRIASLPENPLQTKFPPLYPLYLSAIWKLNSNFPDNLKLATLMSWMVLAILLWLVSLYYRRSGLSDSRTWLLVALLAINPY